ncbi:DUF4044 domain-containing protein [Enterococcus columbae]|uniref:DUF4044 domain-containing protein n=1 Tax=Enterococcus columbae DSM 7374 = ATCC 51263 TaxID=1121865 RepID=S1NK91_9ENTE|nr:DUF4044 domain-containing protein [Enterococcus columbae]EOT42044.1 hypothetical protein OMW_01158 [Enterococcus columbae DSM 7374 = ATCC 51263]EOW80601.1 hypothetical protein I568_01778 [Enterococcus columbae DSM 7374 = ATCC 51263]OJG26322.1 hypothetical protein RR47_GL000070 [Enterococcus columbae DSM 7374 = ATCC 51263]
MNEKKKLSTFEKITKVVVWSMLIITIGGVLLSAVAALM